VIDGNFIISFEYVERNGDTLRSEHRWGPAFLTSSNAGSLVTKKAEELHRKIITAMKDDGIIPPPSNVIQVDFQNRKRKFDALAAI
jgi:hypothetical protein